MSRITLSELVLRHSRNAPAKLNSVKARRKGQEISQKTDLPFLVPAILSDIFIKKAVDNAKNNSKKRGEIKVAVNGNKNYTALENDAPPPLNCSYSPVSKGGAGEAPKPADYGELFSYLGKFRSQSAYENGNCSDFPANNGPAGKEEFSLISRETMETGARYAKYLAPAQDISSASLVPIAGMSSAEWEQFRLWIKIEPVMYRLKMTTS